jgi:hypothetical protein
MPLVIPDHVKLHTEAVELLHAHHLHPGYVYRYVMHGTDTKQPLGNNEQPLPSEETGWERNAVADSSGDVDYFTVSWRRRKDPEVQAAAENLHMRAMHRDEAMRQINMGLSPSTNEIVLPLRMGALLITVGKDNGTEPRTLHFQMRMRSGLYTERQQWMPFYELPLCAEDFGYLFSASPQMVMHDHIAEMLAVFFPDKELSLEVDHTTTVVATHRTGLVPHTRAYPEKSEVKYWLKLNDWVIAAGLPIEGEFTGLHRLRPLAIVSAMWLQLSASKVTLYEMLDDHHSSQAEKAGKAHRVRVHNKEFDENFEYATTMNGFKKGEQNVPIMPDGEGWVVREDRFKVGYGEPTITPSSHTDWKRTKVEVVRHDLCDADYEYMTTRNHPTTNASVRPHGEGWRERVSEAYKDNCTDWVRDWPKAS